MSVCIWYQMYRHSTESNHFFFFLISNLTSVFDALKLNSVTFWISTHTFCCQDGQFFVNWFVSHWMLNWICFRWMNFIFSWSHVRSHGCEFVHASYCWRWMESFADILSPCWHIRSCTHTSTDSHSRLVYFALVEVSARKLYFVHKRCWRMCLWLWRCCYCFSVFRSLLAYVWSLWIVSCVDVHISFRSDTRACVGARASQGIHTPKAYTNTDSHCRISCSIWARAGACGSVGMVEGKFLNEYTFWLVHV